jgi:hypothetical protein
VTAILWLLALAFGCVSAFVAVVVPVLALCATRRHVLQGEDRHVSSLPVVGTMIGCLSVLLLPVGSLRERLLWTWAPPVIEALVYTACVAYWKLSGLEAKHERLRRTGRRGATRGYRDIARGDRPD